MKLLKSLFLTMMFSMFLICSLTGQMNIDINASIRSFTAEQSSDPAIVEIFQDVDRYRLFDFNPDLVYLNARNTGETLNLTFFDDKHYTAEISKAEVNDAGRSVITAKILESDFGYAIITISEDTITISAKVPELDEFFFASVKNGQAYLGQARLSEMAKDELPCGVLDVPHNMIHTKVDECVSTNNNVVIDLLYVYTPAAVQWALNDWRVTDINHLIDIVQATSNLVMANSETGIIFNTVHRHLTNYVEIDSWEDLDRFRQTNDGYMDEVHVLRNLYGADVMVFLAHISFTGGMAALLTDFEGFGEWDNYAASINRIQQASWSYTVVHEIGHNMGAHHHRDQNFQEGPNEWLANYSSGWRGQIQGVMRTSVMAYEAGAYYEDGLYGHRMPYFSTPLISINGTIIGNATLADNARLLRETKVVTAAYRTPPLNNDLTAETIIGSTQLSFNTTTSFLIRVVNSGKNSANNYVINLREIGNPLPLTTINGNLIVFGSYMDYELLWTPTTIGQTQIYGEIVWDIDEKIENNQTKPINTTINPAGIFLLENFNQGTSITTIGWEGDFNSLSGIFIGSGVSGTNALAMYAPETVTSQNVSTPKIGALTLDSILSFEYRIVEFTENWNGPLIPYTLRAGEGVSIEVSSPGEAGSFTPLFQINSSNHISSANFATITHSLFDFAGENVNIRFRKVKTTGEWYFVLDDILVSTDNGFTFFPPRNLSLTTGTGQVVLNWQAPISDGATLGGYKVFRGTTIENMTQIHSIDTNLLPNMSWVNDTDLIDGESYYYGVKASYSAPEIGDSEFSNIENSGPVSDDDETILPTMTALEGNFPNPFNPETAIKFSVAMESIVSIEIFNIRGQRVKRLIDGYFERGFHTVVWNGTDENENPAKSGVYFYRMTTGDYAEVRRMVLMK